MSFQSGAYFSVMLSGLGIFLKGDFVSVSGLDMEFEYETFCEGGSSYPRYFFKQAKPQTLVLQEGTLTSLDTISILVNMTYLGMSLSLSGIISLMDSFGKLKRVWMIRGAHLVKYEGPQLDSNQPNLAVSRIELVYNGCC